MNDENTGDISDVNELDSEAEGGDGEDDEETGKATVSFIMAWKVTQLDEEFSDALINNTLKTIMPTFINFTGYKMAWPSTKMLNV